MGGASSWRREIFNTIHFSHYFDGYGLYEDMDFCIRAARLGGVFVCGTARLEHHHAPSGRPNWFRYGIMVIRNGWYVWRQRWPRPDIKDRLKWWAITQLLTLCRLGDSIRGPNRLEALTDAIGRFLGMVSLLIKRARPHDG